MRLPENCLLTLLSDFKKFYCEVPDQENNSYTIFHVDFATDCTPDQIAKVAPHVRDICLTTRSYLIHHMLINTNEDRPEHLKTLFNREFLRQLTALNDFIFTEGILYDLV